MKILPPAAQLGVGVFNALIAQIAESHRFDFYWLSSFELSACQGLPDLGLLDRITTTC